MQAIRKVIDREIIKTLNIPENYGDKVEIIILPYKEKKEIDFNESLEYMKLQEQSGFVQNILSQKSEDVWNEV